MIIFSLSIVMGIVFDPPPFLNFLQYLICAVKPGHMEYCCLNPHICPI